MKVVLGAVLLLAAALVVLGPTFNVSPEKILEILTQGANELIKFLTKFLEGLA